MGPCNSSMTEVEGDREEWKTEVEGGLTGRKGRLKQRDDWEEGTTEVEGGLGGGDD